MTSLPMLVAPEPIGIVIRIGSEKKRPARFWAYLWAHDDDERVDEPWHTRVPIIHDR
ncbi:MAG: hypothetical protein ACOY71_06420 [Gemmatimonadota bacterium]